MDEGVNDMVLPPGIGEGQPQVVAGTRFTGRSPGEPGVHAPSIAAGAGPTNLRRVEVIRTGEISHGEDVAAGIWSFVDLALCH
jgi:hypothetical protein